MNNVTLVSTTDSEEQIQEALGKATQDMSSEKKSVASKDDAESTPNSEIDEKDAESDDVTDDSNEHDDTESEKDESSEDEKPKKKKSGFKRRLDKVLSRAQKAEQEAQELKAKLASYESKNDESKEANGSASQNKPRPESFDTHEEYVEALVEWKAEEKQKQLESKNAENKKRDEEKNARKSHGSRVQEFKKSHADFDEVISSVDDIETPYFLSDAIIKSDLGPELMYELGKDPDRFEEICAMRPDQALKAIGKLEAKIEQSASPTKTTTTKKQSGAPAPLSPVGGGSASVAKSEDEMSYQEYKAHRLAQTRGKRHG